MATKQTKSNGSSTKLGFEEKLWQAADKLRGHLDAAEYKHVVLGLIFLKYISDAFNEVYEKLTEDEYADPEDRDEYCPVGEVCRISWGQSWGYFYLWPRI